MAAGEDIIRQQKQAALEAERRQKFTLTSNLLRMEAEWDAYGSATEGTGSGGGTGTGVSGPDGVNVMASGDAGYDVAAPDPEIEATDISALSGDTEVSDPSGYSTKRVSEFDKVARKSIDPVPNDLKPWYDTQLFRMRTKIARRAERYERRESERFFSVKLGNGLGTLLDRQATNPGEWQEVQRQGEDYIDNHPTWSPGQKEVQKERWREQQGKRLFKDHPEYILEWQKAQQQAEPSKQAEPGAPAPGGTDDVPIVVANQPGRVSKGSTNGLNPDLLTRFQATQNAYGQSVPIVSGFRDNRTNAKAGGVKGSQHLEGNAIDLDVSGMSLPERRKLIETASANGITGIGVYKNSLHFDIGKRRVWGPSKHADSVPSWAYSSVSKHMAGKAKAASATRVASRSVPQIMEALWPRLIKQESGGNQSAVSSKGATGIAQIMPATGPEAARLAGVPWDEKRFKTDAAYNETLGKAYLADQWKKFDGDPAKALAAYNAGPGRTHAAIEKYGDDWLAHMPAETRGYVASILGGAPASGDGGEVQVQVVSNDAGYGIVGANVHPGLSAVSYEDRVQMFEEYQRKKGEFQTKATDDDISSIRETGVPVVRDVEGMIGMLGEKKAADWLQKREEAAVYHGAVSEMNTRPDDQIRAVIDAHEPVAGSEGYAARLSTYNDIKTKGEKLIQERRDDPALAVEDMASAEITPLKEAARNKVPGAKLQLVEKRLALQGSIGIEELQRQPLTLDEAQSMAERLVLVENDPRALRTATERLFKEIGDDYGVLADEVAGQVLRAKGMDKQTSLIGAAMIRKMGLGVMPTTDDARRFEKSNELSSADKAMNGESVVKPKTGSGSMWGHRLWATGTPSPEAKPKRTSPNAAQVELLRKNPALAPQFDERFGQGAAQSFLAPRSDIVSRTTAPDGSTEITYEDGWTEIYGLDGSVSGYQGEEAVAQ